MFSYVFMKILESRPKRYDRGLAWLSLGQSEKVKRHIVDEHVKPGTRMLEIGVGTGTLAVMAARKGARVLGFDISQSMLDVCRKRVSEEQLDGCIQLREMGVGGMDTLPADSFDLVVSTLVFSELSHDEQVYALRHAKRVLRPGGKIVIADEVRPNTSGKRFLHALVRAPLVLVTYAITQTTTKPLRGLEQLVEDSGYVIESTERQAMGSFVCLVARKE